MILLVVAALGFVGLGVALALVAFSGSDSGGSVDTGALGGGCTLQTFPGQGAEHVATLPSGFKYNSDPPTTGPHNPDPATFDVYDEPVDQMQLVHNLEHGGVVIQYGDEVPREQVDAIVDWYRERPNGIIIAPRAKLGDQIALGAWNAEPREENDDDLGMGILAKCRAFDEDAFDTFMDRYAFKGPERFPEEALAPGA
jgi:hypothetical protein